MFILDQNAVPKSTRNICIRRYLRFNSKKNEYMRMLDVFPEKDLNDVICIYGGSLLETSTFKAGFLTQFEVFQGC